MHQLKLPTWKNAKHGDQWLNTLQTYVFPKLGYCKVSDNTFRKLNQSSPHDIDVHGFRSTFRTWAQDKTDFAREVVEAALSHQEQNAVVAAYARSDLFAKRRSLMEQWEAWCRG